MNLLTLFRGMAWFGVVVVFWSLNVRWGTDLDVPKGAPKIWHRTVVGAGLLSFIAALALSVSGRKGLPPSWLARGVAGGAALIALYIAWSLYSDATGIRADWVGGTGWTWMAAGIGMVTGAVVGSLGLKAPEKPARKKSGGKGGAKATKKGGKSRKRR